MRNLYLMSLFFFASPLACVSQVMPERERDSLLVALLKTKEDSNRVIAWMKFGWWWETYNMDSAAQCYRKMGALANRIGYLEGRFKYYANYTFILNQKGEYEKSTALNLESVELAKKKGTKTQLANCLFNTGSSYNNMTYYNEAITYYLQATKIFESLNLTKNLAAAYSNIGGVFTNIEQYEKGYQYFVKALQKARLTKDPEEIAIRLLNAGIGATKTNRYAEAEKYLLESIRLSEAIDRTILKIGGYLTLAEMYIKKNQFREGVHYAEKGLASAREIGSSYNEVEALEELAHASLQLKDPEKAIQYANLGIEASKKNNIKQVLSKLYRWLGDAEAQKGNFELGYRNIKISHALDDSINQKEVAKKIEQLEIRYQTARKEKQILSLQHEREQQELLIEGLSIGLLIILLVAFLVYKNLQDSKKISEQKRALVEAEMEKLQQAQQLLAAELIMRGEEEERKRLSKDLHDGLGGLLSGVKISLSNMKDNMIMTGDNVLIFERSLDMLDNSISELRRVAHNMMPESLVKFGLSTALGDFCESINKMKALVISFQTVGEQRRLDSSQEIIVYRIVQELLNNILKHSGAERALVQLVFEPAEVALTVEDTGKGFDEKSLDQSTGSGWANIRSRVDYLKGSLDISSKATEGTSVHIRLPL